MTSLQTTQTTNTAVGEWAGFAPDGTEDIAPSFPIIKIVSATSQMPGAAKHVGEFYRTDTEEYYPTLEVVALFQKETRALFGEGNDKPLCRSLDGRAPMPFQPLWDMPSFRTGNGTPQTVPDSGQPKNCTTCWFAQWGENDEPPVCRGSVEVLVDAGDGELANLRLPGSSISTWRGFVARKLKPRKLPLCSQRLTLTTTEKTKPGKKWYEVTIDAEPLSREEALAYNAILSYERQRFEDAVATAGDDDAPLVVSGDDIDDLPYE